VDINEKFDSRREQFLNHFKPKRTIELTNQEVAIMLKQYVKRETSDGRIHEWVTRAWLELSKKQRRVVELRFGMKPGGHPLTCREVANRMGISLRRVQQHWTNAKEILSSVKPGKQNA